MKLGNDPQSRLTLTPLERSVLRALVHRLGDAGPLLEAQCDRVRVVNRSHSGVGFVTRLALPGDAASLPAEAAARIEPVHATHPELRDPAEFLVQMKDGRLGSIEAWCPEGMWPDDDAGFRIEGQAV